MVPATLSQEQTGCPFCRAKLRRRHPSDILRHLRTRCCRVAGDAQQVACPLCAGSFGVSTGLLYTRSALQMHIQSVHAGPYYAGYGQFRPSVDVGRDGARGAAELVQEPTSLSTKAAVLAD